MSTGRAVAALSLLFSCPAYAAPETPAGGVRTPLAALLPTAAVSAEAFQWAAPPRAVELLARFEAAVRAKPLWFSELRARTPANQSLPWHVDLGLDRAEYGEMLTLVGQLELMPAGNAGFWVDREGSTLRFAGDAAAAPLAGLSIDSARGRVVSQFGSCEALAATGGRVAGWGVWTGYGCRVEVPGPSLDDRYRLDLKLGRLTESGAAIVFYEGSRSFRGTVQEQVGVYLRLRAPSADAIASH